MNMREKMADTVEMTERAGLGRGVGLLFFEMDGTTLGNHYGNPDAQFGIYCDEVLSTANYDVIPLRTMVHKLDRNGVPSPAGLTRIHKSGTLVYVTKDRSDCREI